MLTLPQVADQIGRYRILSELGRGSMGQVYLALDPNIDRHVALKVYLPALKVGEKERLELRRRFVLEAKAAGRVEHAGIVTIFDADTDLATDLSYIAMEWVDGRSLQEVLTETGPPPQSRTLEIVEQVAIALDAAHRQGLVHRDVKPGNILCGRDGAIKVTDFGIAKLASMSITHSNWIPGSPFYMSPEQLRNEDVNHRSDIYSLGAVLYECLTGAVPFEADSLPSLTYMILEIDPRPPQTIDSKIDPVLAGVAMRALSKAQNDRFETALDFAHALRGVESEPIQLSRPSSDRRPSGSGTATMPLPTVVPEPELQVDPPAEAEDARSSRLGWAALVLVLAAGALGLRYGPWTADAHPDSRPSGPPLRVGRTVPFSPDLPNQSTLAIELSEPPTVPEETLTERPPKPRPVEAELPPATPPPAPTPSPVLEVKEAPTPPVPVPTGELEIVFRNRLKAASLHVEVDGREIWRRSLNGSKNFFKRSIGRDVWTTIPVPVGDHVIDVRVTGVEAKLDLVRRTEVSVTEDQTHRLRVILIPPRSLRLSWRDAADG